MLRRAIGVSCQKHLVSAPTQTSVRRYIDYHHHSYPVWGEAIFCILGYFLFCWVMFMRSSSVYTKRSEYKADYLRIWRRKLGKGYKWSDEWGPEKKTVFKNLPDRAV